MNGETKDIAVKPSKPKPGRSLAELSKELSAEWDYDENDGLTPNDVAAGSSYIAAWISPEGYKWRASVATRFYNDTGCPYTVPCGKNKKPIPDETSLAATDPQIAAEWDFEANGELTPKDVLRGSNQVVGWICPVHGTRYKAMISNRTYREDSTGCPECVKEKRKKAGYELTRKRLGGVQKDGK